MRNEALTVNIVTHRKSLEKQDSNNGLRLNGHGSSTAAAQIDGADGDVNQNQRFADENTR